MVANLNPPRAAASATGLSISRAVEALEPSATIAMAGKARQLKTAGKTVYDFSLGEPDFTTPEHICAAAAAAMKAGHTHYTAAGGIAELKAAVARQYKERHGLEYAPEQVVIANGAKHALHNAFTALCDPGDEVIIPAPYWVSYAEQVKLAGGKPVIVETEEAADFKLQPEQLRAAITPRAKILLICSPSNPTGSMYSPEELGKLADVVLEAGLGVVADEIYERLVYGQNRFVSFATVRPGLAERTVLVNGVSKSYAMTGWRIGWTMSPAPLAKAFDNLQSQETSNPSSISQYAALAALTGPQQCVDTMLAEFARRREFVRARIARLPDVTCTQMSGAFYAFINIGAHLGRTYGGVRVDNSAQWCLELLSQQNVATVMGSAFGAEGYARLSFATSMQNLEAGLERIEAFLKSAT
ncbi:MAG: pyridoxal phosphate-dependent aminotransferase [Planctomycetia bacterium]|nr:pyridoxal phosphate-dependent aminotransferase [Planctomycetia bacterium]